MLLLEQISALAHTTLKNSNVITTYLPFRANRNRENSFDYSVVAGSVLELLLGKQLKHFDYACFRARCLEEIAKRLTNDALVHHIQQMYFENNALFNASPAFLLLGSQQQDTVASSPPAASKHLSRIFQSFMAQQPHDKRLETTANFIERIFLDILCDYLHDSPTEIGEAPYLPFVAALFVQDLHFFTQNTDYMLQELERFLELYNFLYCAQLALNIRNWEHGEPRSQPLYFILDTEKANQERAHVRNYGYKSLYNAMGDVFPILSMLEYLNDNKTSGFVKQPLWRYVEVIKQASPDDQQCAFQALSAFAEAFRDNRGLPRRLLTGPHTPLTDALGALRNLFQYALDQFKDDLGTARHEIRDKYQREFEQHVARHFVQSRGRSGKVLVMTQDYLMLLTNLAIGTQPQLRFQELLKQFRARGIYVDKQSEQSLLAFYGRVGNVDRMSDSGDAVYVKSTL